MGGFSTAADIYESIRDDPGAQASILAEHKRLGIEIATTDKGGLDLTSATVNGQSFAGARSITKRQRHKMLGAIAAMIRAGQKPSHITIPTFSRPGDH